MSTLVEALRFHGRFGNETEEQARKRRYNERMAAADRIEELEAALAFYADPARWDEFRSDERAVYCGRDTGSDLGNDGGEIARAAIAKTTESA